MKSRFFTSFRLSSFLIIFTLCFFAFSLFASTVSAQIPVSTGGLELSASSNNPVPGQKITITARSYTIDINSAKVSWSVNGKVTQNAVGATILELNAPALGKKTALDVVATTPEGRSVTASLVLGSGSVDLIFETDGYVPPFFKGKVAPVYQNAVKIIAVPHMANAAGVEYDPKTLVYEWKRNSRVIENQSGYGKQFITLVGDIIPRPYDISVTVWPRDDSASAQAYTEVNVSSPFIAFYVDDPLYGVLFNRSVGNTIRIGANKETAVLAVPFGFNKPIQNSTDLSWVWTLNNSILSNLSAHESIVLRSPDGSSGSSNIQLNIQNADKILQGASGAFSALFSSAPTQESVTF